MDNQLSEAAQARIKNLLSQRHSLNQQIEAYIRGLKDSMELEGEDWEIDLSIMAFVPKSPNGRVKDAVGAVTGDTPRELDE
jgi:hypothetical protein